MIAERTLLDGGQAADDVAAQLVPWLAVAQRSLDIALYDVRLPGAVGDAVADAIRAAAARGVAVRIAFNADGDRARKPLPPPPRTDPSLLETLGVPLRAIPGEPDLMHPGGVPPSPAAAPRSTPSVRDAENGLEIVDGALAERVAAFNDAVRACYPAIGVPAYAAS